MSMKLLFLENDSATNFLHEILLRKHPEVEASFERSPSALLNRWMNGEEDYKDLSALVVDVNLPGMSGWEFLDRIEENGIEISNIYIQSTSSFPNDALRAENCHMVTGLLPKPFTGQSLNRWLKVLKG